MKSGFGKAVLVVLVFFALLGVLSTLTNAFGELQATNPLFFAAAAVFFLASVVIWVFSWAILVKNGSKTPFRKAFFLGCASVYGSVSPVQVGSDYLRSVQLKRHFGVPFRDSLAASMLVKGMKFFAIFVLSLLVSFSLLFNSSLPPFVFFALLSGFFMVAAASALFLLPLNERFGRAIAAFFRHASKRFSLLSRAADFFSNYSAYLKRISLRLFVWVFLLSALSLFFEFLALLYSFFAVGVSIPLASAIALFVIASILERAPFLPRGIGLVEAAGFAYLSVPAFSNAMLSFAEIGAIMVVFGVVRIVIPTLLSLAFAAIAGTHSMMREKT
ncbi:MAG: flippase-like domain-containing protein [Candidatus Diapherotrites archaeon]|nr:flippase-like domain-containing protein [Candidatus Diapherotrites archaeon]